MTLIVALKIALAACPTPPPFTPRSTPPSVCVPPAAKGTLRNHLHSCRRSHRTPVTLQTCVREQDRRRSAEYGGICETVSMKSAFQEQEAQWLARRLHSEVIYKTCNYFMHRLYCCAITWRSSSSCILNDTCLCWSV